VFHRGHLSKHNATVPDLEDVPLVRIDVEVIAWRNASNPTKIFLDPDDWAIGLEYGRCVLQIDN
jgi:hypothetical protein